MTELSIQSTTLQRITVIDLARDLLKRGLVVRTWGNMSQRVGASHFVITPSGRNYETMIPSDLSLVDMTGKWRGPFKPSSEHPMHALCYLRDEEIQTVIHTHQPYASALSLAGEDIYLDEEDAAVLGQSMIPTADYALPGTRKLHDKVGDTLRRCRDTRIVLLAAHGALVFAENAQKALELATSLEKVAVKKYFQVVKTAGAAPVSPITHSIRSKDGIRFFDAQEEVTVSADIRQAHERCYRKKKHINAITTCVDGEVAHFFNTTLAPYLDDFAQLVGLQADHSTRSQVVMTQGGALCLGKDLYEAEAVQIVLEKNARAARIATAVGAKPIAKAECLLMNLVYRLKYSKQAE